jgi:anti-sigma regulatory factor (Ser/Thr protein kinase)
MTTYQLHREMSSAREARSVVRGALPKVPEPIRDLAVLLTNELVTNAIIHGAGKIGLALDRFPGHLHIEVSDMGAARPVLRAPDVESESGRGVVIVDALASAWGVRHTDNGKSVWFDLDLDDERSTRTSTTSTS